MGIYSIALIVAAFMAGIGAGSQMGGVLSARVDRRYSLRAFALVELAIGAFGALSCWLYYDVLYVKGGWLYGPAWRSGLLHFAGLFLPTCLMGMSLPFLVRGMVRKVEAAGRTIGFLYGINLLGASLGALLAPWVLIRHFGIRGAVLWAAGASLTAGVLGLALERLAAGEAPSGQAHDEGQGGLGGPESPPSPIASANSFRASGGGLGGPESPPSPIASANSFRASVTTRQPFGLWLALYALSGFVALSLEILWFRVLEVAVKATAFTFGTMLCLYLLGSAVGCFSGAWLAGRLRHPLRAFLLCQCLMLAYSGAAVLVLARLPPRAPLYAWFFDYWSTSLGFMLGQSLDAGPILRLYLLFPLALYGLPTVLMGLSFPILQRAVHDEARTSGRKVGLLQAANIAGCVAGSLLIGLVGLHLVGSTGSLRLLLAVGILFAALGLRTGARPVFATLTAALAVLAVMLPGQRSLWLRLHGTESAPSLVEEDATGVAAIVPQPQGPWRVFVNGKHHSWVPFGGGHTRLGGAPAMVHPAPVDVAIIGLGSGDTAWAVAARPETRSVTVFEISAPQPRLLRRLAAVAELPALSRLLADPRMRIVTADGRRALREDGARYDIIEADALWPEVAYSGNLYSVEFFRECARRLKPGGIMCTWSPTPRIYASFSQVFPHMLGTASRDVLIGSLSPLSEPPDAWPARLYSAPVVSYLGREQADNVAGLLGKLIPLNRRGWRHAGLDANEDLFPRDEFMAP